jgi:regulator of replication initiation timing
MKKDKLKNYTLTAGIHTVAVKSQGAVDDVQSEVEQCITASVHPGRKGSDMSTTSIINPNKLFGDLYSFDECCTAVQTILAGAGIDDYQVIRADVRFDSPDLNHYREFQKLNRYLISALAVAYKVKNAYCSVNLFSQKQLSVAVKNKYFEIENYDKAAESHGKDPAASRFEIRSKCFKDQDLRKEFLERWPKRLEKAMKNLEEVQGAYNDALEDLYREGLGADEVRFRSMTDFLIQYQDCIFCKKQLMEFLGRFPDRIKNPVTYAENFKKRYKIEYFSESDIQYAVNEITRAAGEFFGAEERPERVRNELFEEKPEVA